MLAEMGVATGDSGAAKERGRNKSPLVLASAGPGQRGYRRHVGRRVCLGHRGHVREERPVEEEEVFQAAGV